MDAPAPRLTRATDPKSLPDRTFGAHHPKCLAGLEELHRDSLPFKHVQDVGYVDRELLKLLYKASTTGTCSEVCRWVNEGKMEAHLRRERLRLQLILKAAQQDREARYPYVTSAALLACNLIASWHILTANWMGVSTMVCMHCMGWGGVMLDRCSAHPLHVHIIRIHMFAYVLVGTGELVDLVPMCF